MNDRASYLQVRQMYVLNLACQPIRDKFGGLYLVGSVLTRPDYRDVDIRCMLDDEVDFAIVHSGFMNAAISDWLAARTGLPVDFQFQWTEQANKEFSGMRNAIGMRKP